MPTGMTAEELIEEVSGHVPSFIPDISDDIITTRILNNARDHRMTSFVYMFEYGDEVPIDFKAVSGIEQFSNNFEFLVV